MQKIIHKLKNIDKTKLLIIIDNLIEHRLFRPLAVSIIVSFVLFRGFAFIQNLVASFDNEGEREVSPIKINISGSKNLNLEEDRVAEYEVKSGDTLMKVLLNLDVAEADVVKILEAVKKVFNPRYIVSGNHVTVKYKTKIELDQTQSNVKRKVTVNELVIIPSFEQNIVVSRSPDGEFKARDVKVELSKHIVRYSGTIKRGLFVDGVEAGVSPTSMMNMINLLGYDVDFQRDIHSGDKFEMIVENYYSKEGKKLKDGNVLFSSLQLSNRSINLYMHEMKGGAIEYFDEKGSSIKKSLLRTPINGARVSSGFGMRRHPILGYSRMHKGTDFAAPSGTPILAAGDGIIVHYGRKGAYGNYVRIKHNDKYSTAYGHASKFNNKLRLGSKVKQGQIVAYVGTTGRSTGPHLHFEVLINDEQVNPAKIKATSGINLSGKELERFKDSKRRVEEFRKNIPNQLKST